MQRMYLNECTELSSWWRSKYRRGLVGCSIPPSRLDVAAQWKFRSCSSNRSCWVGPVFVITLNCTIKKIILTGMSTVLAITTVLDILWHELDDALLALKETVEFTVPPLNLAWSGGLWSSLLLSWWLLGHKSYRGLFFELMFCCCCALLIMCYDKQVPKRTRITDLTPACSRRPRTSASASGTRSRHGASSGPPTSMDHRKVDRSSCSSWCGARPTWSARPRRGYAAQYGLESSGSRHRSSSTKNVWLEIISWLLLIYKEIFREKSFQSV